MAKKKDDLENIVVPIIQNSTPEQTSQVGKDQSAQDKTVKTVVVSQTTNLDTPQPRKNKKTGMMISTILCTVFGILLAAGAVALYLSLYLNIGTESDAARGFLATFIFVITYGLITYVPALILSIVAIVTASLGLHTDFKGQKAICIIFLILSILLLTALILAFILACLLTTSL